MGRIVVQKLITGNRELGTANREPRRLYSIFGGMKHLDASSPSEPAAQGDEDFAVAGVAYGDTEGYEAKGRVAYQADSSVLAKKRALLGGPDFPGFITDEAAEALAEAGGESGKAVHVSAAREIEVGAAVLIECRRGEAHGAAEREAIRLGDVGAQVGLHLETHAYDVVVLEGEGAAEGELGHGGVAAADRMVERSGRRGEPESAGRDGARGCLVEVEVQQAGLRGSCEIGAAARTRSQTPAHIRGAPLGGDLHGVAEGAADLEAGNQVLLKAFCNSLLVGPDEDRFARDGGARLQKESAWREAAIVLGSENCLVAEFGGAAELGAEATKVLIDEAQIHFHARDVGSGSGQLGADDEIGRTDGILAEADQDAGIVGRGAGGSSGSGASGQRGGKGLKGCVISAVGLDGREGVDGGDGSNRLAIKRFQIGENAADCAGRGAFYLDLAEGARLRKHSGLARGEVDLPIVVVEGVTEQGGAVLFGSEVAGADNLAALGVIGAG